MNTAMVESGVAVGPARVTSVQDGVVHLSTPTGPVDASLALACPYSPHRGDLVLLLRSEKVAYIVGVLKTVGPMRLDLPGDVVLRAGGRLRLAGGEAVEIEAPEIRLRADRVETTARAVFERVVDAYRWARGVAQTTAGRVRTLVSGTASLQAERITESASKDVRIDGERINIG
ncbi:MAG TPA: DUF3540 domain-containing protein [Planctomycetota bacterium]|nr:DUF3540 domain-containing protein [Planctomycetota bacterium]